MALRGALFPGVLRNDLPLPIDRETTSSARQDDPSQKTAGLLARLLGPFQRILQTLAVISNHTAKDTRPKCQKLSPCLHHSQSHTMNHSVLPFILWPQRRTNQRKTSHKMNESSLPFIIWPPKPAGQGGSEPKATRGGLGDSPPMDNSPPGTAKRQPSTSLTSRRTHLIQDNNTP